MLDPLVGVDLDPKAGQYRVIEQPVAGVPADSSDGTFRDAFAFGGGIVLQPTTIAPRGFTVNAAPLPRLRGKTTINPGDFDIGDVDPNNYLMLHFLTNLFGAYAISNPVAGVTRWLAEPGAATPATRNLTLDDYTGFDTPVRHHDVRVGRMTVRAQANSNLAVLFNAGGGAYAKAGDVVQVQGAASTLPKVWKTWPANYPPEDVNGFIWFKLVVDNGDGTIDVQCGLGAAGAPPVYANTQTITLGEPFPIFDVDGSRIGIKAEQPVGYWPVGAVLTFGATPDEFRIPYKRAVWSQSLGIQRRISSVSASVSVDGKTIATEGGWELVVERTVNARPDVYGQQGATLSVTGDFVARLVPTKEIKDATFQTALQRRTPLSAVIDAETEVLIGASAFPFRFVAILPHCTPEGNVFQREPGAENRDEQPTLIAGVPDNPFTYDAPHLPAPITTSQHVAIVVENDVASL